MKLRSKFLLSLVLVIATMTGGTLLTVVQSGFPSVEVRDFFGSVAWVGAFDRIEALLTR